MLARVFTAVQLTRTERPYQRPISWAARSEIGGEAAQGLGRKRGPRGVRAMLHAQDHGAFAALDRAPAVRSELELDVMDGHGAGRIRAAMVRDELRALTARD